MPIQSSVNRTFTVTKNTFREAVRDRILYNLVLFVLLITASAIFLGDLTDGHEARTIVNLGLSAMLLFGVFIAIFVGVSLVSKEIDKRTIYALLSKPVSRSEFIIGKYLGLCLTLLVNILVMGAGVSVALLFVGGKSLALSIWGAIALIFIELTIVTAVAILFSSFSSPAISALLTFFIFIIGNFSASLREFSANFGLQTTKFFFDFLYYVLPNLSFYSFTTNAAHGEIPPASMFFAALVYALIYIAILLVISVAIFNQRNFK